MISDGREPWQQDLSLPTIPEEPCVHTFKSMARLVGRLIQPQMEAARKFGKQMALVMHTVEGTTFASMDPALVKPKSLIRSVRPFPHDPPTNLLYPTSFDNWFNEYDQPIRGSQQFQRKSRKTRRR